MSCTTTHPPYREIDKLTPTMQRRVAAWLSVTPEIFLTETWRSDARQACLLQEGKSRIQRSRHQDGEAVDIAFRGETLYPPVLVYAEETRGQILNPWWREVADKALQYGLRWGYDLWATSGFIDAAHFELHTDPAVLAATDPLHPVPLSPWEQEQRTAREWVMESGISNGERGPEPLTRSEAWVMLYRMVHG